MKLFILINKWFSLIFLTILTVSISFNILNAQSPYKLIVEPYSGFSWTKYHVGITPNLEPKAFYRYFRPGNYTGLSFNLEKKKYGFGLDIRGQRILWKNEYHYSWDTIIAFNKTYICVLRLNAKYLLINKPRWISSLNLGYSIPTGTSQRVTEIVDRENYGTYWYQRTGAYYLGINCGVRDRRDKFRLHLHFGIEKLRNNNISLGDWYEYRDKNRLYYMAGLNLSYTVNVKKKKNS